MVGVLIVMAMIIPITLLIKAVACKLTADCNIVTHDTRRDGPGKNGGFNECIN